MKHRLINRAREHDQFVQWHKIRITPEEVERLMALSDRELMRELKTMTNPKLEALGRVSSALNNRGAKMREDIDAHVEFPKGSWRELGLEAKYTKAVMEYLKSKEVI